MTLGRGAPLFLLLAISLGCGTERFSPEQRSLGTQVQGIESISGWWPCAASMFTWSSPWGAITGYSNGTCSGRGDCNCNGTGAYGYQYQCVELVNRFMIANRSQPRIWGNADVSMCNSAASSGYSVYRGSGPQPEPGDALVWDGHAALVVDNSPNSIGYMQQNYGNASTWNQATDNVSWNGSNFGPLPGVGYPPVCWIHTGGGGGGPTCPTGGDWAGAGRYCGSNGVSGGAPDTLYYCSSPGAPATPVQACGEGCRWMPPGVDDECYAGSCNGVPFGDGYYCGTHGLRGTGNPDGLYLCRGGSIASYNFCSYGCYWAPDWVDDYCNPPPAP